MGHVLGSQIKANRETLAQAVVEAIYATAPTLCPRSPGHREKSVQDVGYHLSFLAESLIADDEAIFVEYIGWAKVLLSNLGLGDQVVSVTLDFLEEVLPRELGLSVESAARAQLCAILAHAKERAAQGPLELPSYLDAQAPLATLARAYLDALLAGDRRRASTLVLEAADRGVAVRDIYAQVFQPSQYEIGRLWQQNLVTVAQEHFCTAATQLIMSQLYPRIFATAKNGRTLVATCIGGELHEIGVRMVADIFEMEGWDTYYLGASTPAAAVVEMLVTRGAQVLAISATLSLHLSAVRDLIADVRRNARVVGVKVIVGGYPFNLSPSLWQKIGADGHALDAERAVALATTLAAGAAEGRR